MVVSKSRRKSIAVPTQNQPSLVPKNRRRAHSIVPGALSPFSKARRSLAPRKSILKSSVLPNVDPSSQQSTSTLEENNSMPSIDITQDLSAPDRDNTTRKSFGRRVSWFGNVQVKLFDPKRRNGTSSSPSSTSSPSRLIISNENEHPVQNSRRRRSSTRYSTAGSEDMDMTTVVNCRSYPATESAILEEEFDYEDDIDDDDMEMTEAIQGNLSTKRSVSIGRQPLSQLRSPSQIDNEAHESRSDENNESMEVSVSEDQSQIMEFTVPLGQSLRPADQDQAWLALKRLTHSGNELPEPTSDDSAEDHGEVGINLEDAMQRLRRARDSLPLSSQPVQPTSRLDESYTSTEDSFEGDNDDEGNKTLNLSHVIGRTGIGRISVGYQDSNMDESEVYGNIVQFAPELLQPPKPRSSNTLEAEAPVRQVEPSVFQAPPTTSAVDSAPAGSSVFTRPISPSKVKQVPSLFKAKPTFSAAFAPPVTKPSPKKPVGSPGRIPAKRPRTTHDGSVDTDRPSPVKKPVLADKWMKITAREEVQNSPRTPAPVIKPKPLSPSKKAIFQNPGVHTSTAPKPPAPKRLSGYFARRKSLAAGFDRPPTSQLHPGSASSSPKKVVPDFRRLSVGSTPSIAHQFDQNPESENQPFIPGVLSNGQENEDANATSSPPPVPVVSKPASRLVPQNVNIFERPVIPVLAVTLPIEQSLDIVSQVTEIDVEATQQWRDAVQQDDYVGEDESPAISISQFFQMTGIKYMDELAAPRRSLHPGMQPIPQSRNASDIPLAEFVTAMAIDVPQLDLYSRVSTDLEAWVEKSKVVFAQAEEEAAKVTPELFVEYARADEVGREELAHQLTLIRTHTRYLARSDWYDWKLQWVEGLRHTAGEAFKSLEDDARTLEGLKNAADAVFPALEKEYEQVMQELKQEQAEVKEIEFCDQDYLNELKASIAEQNIEIEALKAELSEAMDQSNWLQEKLQEIDTQKNEAQNTIRTAERLLQMKQTSTRSEVFRLKAELEALEDLHMLNITKVSANIFEYIYASIFHVSIPCTDFRPIVSKVRIKRSAKRQKRYKDDFPKLSTFLLASANYLINNGEDLNVREIVHHLADFWSAASQLRSQLVLLKVKYPVDILVSSPQSQDSLPYFRAKAQVLFPSVHAKAFVYFTFSFETLTQWPLSLGSLDCEVEVAYGPVERSPILKAVTDRLGQVTPAENYACLLDACIEAQDVYH